LQNTLVGPHLNSRAVTPRPLQVTHSCLQHLHGSVHRGDMFHHAFIYSHRIHRV